MLPKAKLYASIPLNNKYRYMFLVTLLKMLQSDWLMKC